MGFNSGFKGLTSHNWGYDNYWRVSRLYLIQYGFFTVTIR